MEERGEIMGEKKGEREEKREERGWSFSREGYK